jgi:hypothetical protein
MPNAAQESGVLNICPLRRGDEYRRVVTLPGLDLTGYTLTLEVFSLTSRAVKLTVTPVFSTPPHAVTVSFSEAQTGSLLPGNYGLRMVFVSPAGVTRTFLEGVMEVTA